MSTTFLTWRNIDIEVTATATEGAYGAWVQPERQPGPGRPPGPRRRRPAGLADATVTTRREQGRVAGVIRAVVFGVGGCWKRGCGARG